MKTSLQLREEFARWTQSPEYQSGVDFIADYWLSQIADRDAEVVRSTNAYWKLALTHLPEQYRKSVLATHEKICANFKSKDHE